MLYKTVKYACSKQNSETTQKKHSKLRVSQINFERRQKMFLKSLKLAPRYPGNISPFQKGHYWVLKAL